MLGEHESILEPLGSELVEPIKAPLVPWSRAPGPGPLKKKKFRGPGHVLVCPLFKTALYETIPNISNGTMFGDLD